jgi:hypothetical protein
MRNVTLNRNGEPSRLRKNGDKLLIVIVQVHGVKIGKSRFFPSDFAFVRRIETVSELLER